VRKSISPPMKPMVVRELSRQINQVYIGGGTGRRPMVPDPSMEFPARRDRVGHAQGRVRRRPVCEGSPGGCRPAQMTLSVAVTPPMLNR